MAIIHGAMTDECGDENVTENSIKHFNNISGKNIGICYFTDKWAENPHIKFPKEKCDIIRRVGATPMIRLQNSEDPDGAPGSSGKFAHSKISNGDFDIQLKQYALDVKVYANTVILEYGTEINGDWFSWSTDESKDEFKKAFKHIVKIFQDNHATNAQFAFHCDATDNDDSLKWYPGDDFVQWVGTSCYGADTKKGCINTLDECYTKFEAISKTARLGIFEWGTGDKEDTATTLAQIPTKYPKIELLQIWNETIVKGHNEDKVPDGRIDASFENLMAYREGISNSIYTSSLT